MLTITPTLVEATRARMRHGRRALTVNPHMMRALKAGEPQSAPLRGTVRAVALPRDQGQTLDLAQENARLRHEAGVATATKKDWIAIALLAAAGRMTVADVLMRANPRAMQSPGQSMNAAVEAARGKLGPAVANPLLEQAGLV